MLLKDLRFQLQLYALKIIPKLKNKSNAVVSDLHLKGRFWDSIAVMTNKGGQGLMQLNWQTYYQMLPISTNLFMYQPDIGNSGCEAAM